MSTVHTVVKGDTLSGIAKKYGTTVSNLKKVNNLTSDTIKIGQKLKIPSSQTSTTTNTPTTTPNPSSLFKQMWGNFPKSNVKHNADAIDNYCAINLSEALIKSNIAISGGNCWGCPTGKNNTHYLRASEMAEWLKKKPFKGCPAPIKATGKDFKEKFNNKKGIIYFQDYWQRAHEKGTDKRTGDHIDLWDATGLVSQLASFNIFLNFATNSLGFSWDGWLSSKELSTEVLLWEIE